MYALFVADLYKIRKHAIGPIMLAIVLLLSTLIMLEASTAQLASRTSYSFPQGILEGSGIFSQFGVFLAIIFGAVLVGSEYAYDTWKTLLTRRHGRAIFLVSKWLTLLTCLSIGFLITMCWTQVQGWLFDGIYHLSGPRPTLSAGMLLLLLVQQLWSPFVAGSIGLAGAAVGRSSVAGIVAGFLWFIVDIIIASYFPLVSFTVNMRIVNQNLGIRPLSPSLLLSLGIVILYTTIPFLLAAYIFKRRDMVQ